MYALFVLSPKGFRYFFVICHIAVYFFEINAGYRCYININGQRYPLNCKKENHKLHNLEIDKYIILHIQNSFPFLYYKTCMLSSIGIKILFWFLLYVTYRYNLFKINAGYRCYINFNGKQYPLNFFMFLQESYRRLFVFNSANYIIHVLSK